MKSETDAKPYIRWTILSLTTLSSFMVAVDSTIVVIGLPIIGKDLHSGVSLLGWIITAYVLATAALLLQFGKLGDRHGKKKVYLIGFAVFGVASAICGISSGIYELVAFRLMQGVGAAMLGATSYPLIFASFPKHERGTAMGINSIAWAVGAVTGPVLGGFLVSVDWRLVFFINVPVAFIAVVVGMKRMPSYLNIGSPVAKEINLLNSFILALTVAMTLLWLTLFEPLFALAGLACFITLVISEKKSRSPLIDRELKNGGFWFSSISLAISNLGVLGIPFVLTFYYQIVKGYSPIQTGIFIVPLSIALAISNPLSGRLFDKMKLSGILSLIGVVLNGSATLTLGAYVIARASPVDLIIPLVVVGVGGGLIWTPLLGSALKFSKPELRGVANGTSFTLLNLGFAASIAMLIAVSATFLPKSIVSQIYLGNLSGLSLSEIGLFNHGMAESLLILAIVDFLAAIPIILTIIRQRESKEFGT